MPKPRTKASSSRNGTVAPAPVPLLDSLRAQMQPVNGENNDNESDSDNFQASTAGWQCDMDDWSDRNPSNKTPDRFPPSIRSIERQYEQAKNNFFSHANENENKQQIHEQSKVFSSDNIDISKLSMIVNDLLTGRRDQVAYTDFLSILQNYSVHSSRDDHLEETIYHLIQAAVHFIRSNEQRFDPNKLEECYRKRAIRKTNFAQSN